MASRSGARARRVTSPSRVTASGTSRRSPLTSISKGVSSLPFSGLVDDAAQLGAVAVGGGADEDSGAARGEVGQHGVEGRHAVRPGLLREDERAEAGAQDFERDGRSGDDPG